MAFQKRTHNRKKGAKYGVAANMGWNEAKRYSSKSSVMENTQEMVEDFVEF